MNLPNVLTDLFPRNKYFTCSLIIGNSIHFK